MGVVKGRVVTMTGNPVPNAKVRGSVGGLLGMQVFATTDGNGRFVLNYAGVGSLEFVSVDGGDREEDVPTGSDLTLYR